MTERQLQNFVSIFLIVAHIGILGLVLVLGVMKGLTAPDFSTALLIIIPMMGTLTGMAVTYIISAKRQPPPKARSMNLSGVYVFASLLFPIAFLVTITGLVLAKATNFGNLSSDQFRLGLAATETLFGAYSGKLMGSLFEKGPAR